MRRRDADVCEVYLAEDRLNPRAIDQAAVPEHGSEAELKMGAACDDRAYQDGFSGLAA